MPRFVTVSLCLVLALVACDSAPREPVPVTQGSPSAEDSSPSPASMPSSPAPAVEPGFEGGVTLIGPRLREILIGRNWTPGCPVPLEDLRLVKVSYWNFHGEVRTGPFVLHKRVAEDVLWVFKRLFRAKFPIKAIKLAAKDRPRRPEDYWNMSRWSTSASFNCRPATDSSSLSQHSYGWALDINPLQNPYVRGDGTVLRHIAIPFKDRSFHRKGMIHDGDIVVRSFARIGWKWGGHWHSLKDYMHFSLTGR
jgi:hypothetical protein